MHINACFGKHSPAFASRKNIQARVQNLLSTLVLANEGLFLWWQGLYSGAGLWELKYIESRVQSRVQSSPESSFCIDPLWTTSLKYTVMVKYQGRRSWGLGGGGDSPIFDIQYYPLTQWNLQIKGQLRTSHFPWTLMWLQISKTICQHQTTVKTGVLECRVFYYFQVGIVAFTN